ncbi:hypothetical protein M4D49_29055 [Cupriavidus pauculus]|uniref:hypothetical protein n=1 Tax=Cupriavidus TaxID=106589 RepID=UPI000493969C|nr:MULTISPECIES: hypothetical protein [Cupriavidus]MCM3609527.1 hypothetical protein [Cupriavidus pauculus]
MGQAKQRGTKEQRIAQAKEKLAALRPETLVCGACQTAFSEFEAMDTRGMRGIDAAFAGQCPSCRETVIAFKGEPDAVADAAIAWQDAMGVDGKLGSQSPDGRYTALEDE